MQGIFRKTPILIRRLFIVIVVAFFLSGCATSTPFKPPAREDSRPVRVAVLRGAPTLTLEVNGPYAVINLKTGRQIAEHSLLRSAEVKLVLKDIQIGEERYEAEQIKIVPHFDGSLYINHRRLRGVAHLIRGEQGLFLVVNVVDLENYVRGVLSKEVPDRWPLEAIKAQAVAVRTYAMYSMQNSRSVFFDVTDDIYSQVYGGKASERYRTNMAAERTVGLVLTYRDKILPAFYHATCGGHTENALELWQHDLVPLKGVACPFCEESPHYHWKRNLRLKDIQDALNEKGYTLGLIRDIEVVDRNSSGRIRTLRITARDDQQATISGKDFRQIIGPNIIKSNNFTVDMKGYFVDLLGHGWGHGVGLCQWGARFMAEQRYDFDEILSHYYLGARLVPVDQVRER